MCHQDGELGLSHLRSGTRLGCCRTDRSKFSINVHLFCRAELSDPLLFICRSKVPFRQGVSV